MDKSLVNFDSEYSYLVNFEESVSEKPSLKLTGRPEAGLVSAWIPTIGTNTLWWVNNSPLIAG